MLVHKLNCSLQRQHPCGVGALRFCEGARPSLSPPPALATTLRRANSRWVTMSVGRCSVTKSVTQIAKVGKLLTAELSSSSSLLLLTSVVVFNYGVVSCICMRLLFRSAGIWSTRPTIRTA